MEVLLATALMGMILAAMATVTAQWLPNWNRGFVAAQRSELFALGLERLVADLAAAESISLGRKDTSPLFDGTPTSITFVRSALGPNSRPGLEIVRVAEAPDEFVPMLVRSTAPFFPRDDDTPVRFGNPVTLVRAPYRISFSYAGPDRVWRETWRGAALLPRAVRLQVRDAGTGQLLSVSTATVIHNEVPVDCALSELIANCLDGRRRSEAARLNELGGPGGRRGVSP
jgi:general secretion pathway protein J